VSASEANRSFAALLRQVAQGQSFTVHSHGRAVANLTPVSGEACSWQRGDLYE
jgi:prevent-host-death family protein